MESGSFDRYPSQIPSLAVRLPPELKFVGFNKIDV